MSSSFDPSPWEPLKALLPAVLLGTSAFASGNFQAPIWPQAVLGGHLLLLATILWVPVPWRDLLGLGAAGRWLLVALSLWMVVGWWLSPVPRAGRLVLGLWPLYLLLPSVVARCWSTPPQRRLGLLGVAVAVGSVAAYGCWHGFTGESLRTALPLGHHNLLAIWLLVLLPLLFPLFAATDLRPMAVAGPAVGFGLLALLATASLSALIAAAVVLQVVFWRAMGTAGGARPWWRRRGYWIWGFGMAMLVTWLPRGQRFHALWQGQDHSLLARRAYWQGGWQGVLERPWGWGVGSTPWTLGDLLPPSPGVVPAGEAVGHLHMLPLTILYEIGWPGFLMCLCLAVLLWRRLKGTARLAVLGFGVASLGGAPMAILALPTALAVAVGAGMEGAREEEGALSPPSSHPRRWPTLVLCGVVACWILPLDLASLHYDRAIEQESLEGQKQALDQAVAMDPSFPLYGFQSALVRSGLDGGEDSSVRSVSWELWQGARRARGVGPLWLVAGAMGQGTENTAWSLGALIRACASDPLSAMAPFLLAVGEPVEERSASWGARALVAEPRLLAAVEWRHRPRVLEEAVGLLVDHGDIDAGWRQRLLTTYRQLSARNGAPGELRQLALSMDTDETTSVSLYTFRRRPWPTILATVELEEARLESIDLVSLSALAETSPALYGDGCRLAAEERSAAPPGLPNDKAAR